MLTRYDEHGLAWMDSNGGPLLLVPGEFLTAWEGIEPPSGGRRVEADFRWDDPDAPATDYDQACDVDEYLGQVDIGGGYGLVLGREIASAMWLPRTFADEHGYTHAGGLLIRWIYADSMAHTIAVLKEVPEALWADEAMTLTVGQEPLYLIDSAYAGSQLRDNDHLIIDLPAGQYTVATAIYQPDNSTHLVLHRFSLVPRLRN